MLFVLKNPLAVDKDGEKIKIVRVLENKNLIIEKKISKSKKGNLYEC